MDAKSNSGSEVAAAQRHWPVFILSTAVTCSLVMIYELFENGRSNESATTDCELRVGALCFAPLSMNPLLGPSSKVLLRMGGKLGPLIAEDKEVWRLFAAMYLHGGLVHLLVNMFVLVQVGRSLELVHGTIKVAVVYVLSGVFGVITGAIFDPHTLSVGASGAIFGLLGSCVGDLLQNWALHKHPRSSLLRLVLISAIQLLLGTIPMLDNFAHCFGFIMGLLCSLSLFIAKRQTRHTGRILATKCHQRILQILAAMIIPTILMISLSVLFGTQDGTDLCPWCAKISCIPFPWGCDESKPASSSDCWFHCSAAVDPRCSVAAMWTDSITNGTAVVQCPAPKGAVQNVTVWPVDLTDWGPPSTTALCRDQCS